MEDLYPPVEYDDGTMPANVAEFAEAVVGHRIVKVERRKMVVIPRWGRMSHRQADVVFTLDTGQQVALLEDGDCCAYTQLDDLIGNLADVDHVVTQVKPSPDYHEWYILADYGEMMRMKVDWSSGNTGYYGYGFSIHVLPVEGGEAK